MLRLTTLLGVLFLSLNLSTIAEARALHETMVFKGILNTTVIDQWSKLPGPRSYLFRLDHPTKHDLQTLAGLKNADRLQIEVQEWPKSADLPQWKALAALGAEFVGFTIGLPIPPVIDTLNEIGFSRYVFVLTSVPSSSQSQALKKLHAPASISFSLNGYPKFLERDALRGIPTNIPLQFAANFWPRYVHMDVMNMLPQTLKLRVSGVYPSTSDFEYLRQMKNLDEVIVDNDYDQSVAELWKNFGQMNVRWSSQNHVPSQASLDAFAESANLGPRRLVIDQDQELSRAESDRLISSPLAVEWIHSAPGSDTALGLY
jgi:hypothetical protein